MDIEVCALEGQKVLLEPLSAKHEEGLIETVTDGELWNIFFTSAPKPEDMGSFIAASKDRMSTGDEVVFATIDKRSRKVVGSTRFMNISVKDRCLEIGFTFIAQSFQRTVINTEAKLLMMQHAFEVLNANRVAFLTDYLNANSRNAILRLGAKQEGILRNHKLMQDGRIRDSVVFSVISNEWPGVKSNLLYKLKNAANTKANQAQ